MITDKASYDKAKAELKDKQWRKDNLQGSAEFTWHMKKHITLISAALLAYRRAHNIYEIGDRVVLLKNQHMWHKMESIYTVASTDIYEGVTIGVAIRHKNTSFGDELGNIRHATDEEIAAGRRLDQ